ncbi:MAG: Prepilin-type N-terminal cleavage/methylation protein [Acidobacteriota bacterium]|nr:Prepilin-type N-terminal cleavage/methylation protein [Acidobacteriota bacterium]
MKITMHNERGFSLLELMITTTIFLVVLLGVYTMVSHFADTSRTENSRLRMQQETRYLTVNFAGELKNAGSVLTIANSGSFLRDDPYFCGIYPLNNAGFPDGIIIAIGDPEAVTTLTAPHTFSSDGVELQVKSTEVPVYYDEPADETTISVNPDPWAAGDIGIVVGTTGYYVFAVESVTADTITTRAEPVYYSGLLNTSTGTGSGQHYFTDGELVKGNNIQYPGSEGADVKAPVIRLSSFSIYLFKEIPHPIYYYIDQRMLRQFVRVSDARGIANVLNNANAVVDVISENIWDMQITYSAYEDFAAADPTTAIDPNHYYFGPDDSSSNVLENLLADIRGKFLKQFNIDFVTITDEYGIQGNYKHGTVSPRIPPLGDSDEYIMDRGRFGFKILTLQIEPRNFNIQL